MKKIISISIDEELIPHLKNRNKSRYVERLIKDDIQIQNKRKIIPALKDELLQDESFFAELANRLGGKTPITVSKEPKQDILEDELPKCCKTQKKCKHWEYDGMDGKWVHKLTGESKEAF